MSKDTHGHTESGKLKKTPKSVLPSAPAGTDERLRRLAHAKISSGYLAELERGLDTTELGARGPPVRALHDGVLTVNNDFLADGRSASSRSVASQAGFVAATALPISFRGEVIGELKLYSDEPEAFGTQEVSGTG